MIISFGVSGRDVVEASEQALIVESVDPAQRYHFDSGRGRPRPLPPDQLGVIEGVDSPGGGIIVRLVDAPERRREVTLGHMLRIVHCQVKLAAWAVSIPARTMSSRCAHADCLLASERRAACPCRDDGAIASSRQIGSITRFL